MRKNTIAKNFEPQECVILVQFKKQEAQMATYPAPEYNVPPF